jgi:hypothetical protein
VSPTDRGNGAGSDGRCQNCVIYLESGERGRRPRWRNLEEKQNCHEEKVLRPTPVFDCKVLNTPPLHRLQAETIRNEQRSITVQVPCYCALTLGLRRCPSQSATSLHCRRQLRHRESWFRHAHSQCHHCVWRDTEVISRETAPASERSLQYHPLSTGKRGRGEKSRLTT